MPNPFRTPERDAFRKTLREFVAAELTPNADAWDEQGKIPWEVHQKVGALGVWGFGIDEKYGGLGFDDAFMRAIYNEEISLCGAGGVGAALNGRMISVEPISRLANEDIRRRSLPDILSGHAGSCLGITEPGGGSDVAAMQTTARRDGDSYVINGAKTFITGSMTASYFVIGARTGKAGLGGISLFFVDEGTPGFSRTPLERKMGWWCSDQATLYFDECRVPASHMMGEARRRHCCTVLVPDAACRTSPHGRATSPCRGVRSSVPPSHLRSNARAQPCASVSHAFRCDADRRTKAFCPSWRTSITSVWRSLPRRWG